VWARVCGLQPFPQMEGFLPTRILKAVISLFLAVLVVWFLFAHEQAIRSNIKGRDSTLYWATATLLMHGGNPYSIPDVLALERQVEYASEKTEKPKMYRPPPWSMWMILPLGFTSAYWAWVSWMALSMIALVYGIRISWRLYGDGRTNPALIFLLPAYLFAPVAACLVLAQMGTILLLSIALFFFLAEKRPLLAGAALLPAMAKPHFFAPLWVILIVWAVNRRKWLVLCGASAAFLLANAIALTFDHSIFRHYHDMLQLDDLQNEFMPNVSGMIRVLFFLHHFWVQFVPAALGMAGCILYYWRNRETWDWRAHGPWLLIIGALVAPYSWLTDEVALLPAVLQGVVWLSSAKLRVRSQLAILVFVCFDLLLLLIVRAKVDPFTGIYFWSSLVWFSWYWYASSFREKSSVEECEPPLPRQQALPLHLTKRLGFGDARQRWHSP